MREYQYPLGRLGKVAMTLDTAGIQDFSTLALAERVERLVELFESVIDPGLPASPPSRGVPARIRTQSPRG